MKNFFGYIRVSTVKQGQQGVSLQEQRDAILRYTSQADIKIIDWFEEQVTAAKHGRPVFTRMLKLLRQGKADGIVIHKIDRGARNLRDWSTLAELNDEGIDVHLASESLDMRSRGGRLSADIQAVVAADFIRNLRDETRKGFYGRLKQGYYPLPAPTGYINNGKAKAKTPDPVMAPLVKKAFELYVSGTHTIDTLVPILHNIGLRNRNGKPMSRNNVASLLNNIFYTGLIRIRKTGETFSGLHAPLIPMPLFEKVHDILTKKTNTQTVRHDFLFRRLLRCKSCGSTLIGELQKGHVYYRCHTGECPMTCIREEKAEETVIKALKPFSLSEEERDYVLNKIELLKNNWEEVEEKQRTALQLRLGQCHDRMIRLTDAFLDGSIDRDIFQNRKSALLIDTKNIEASLGTLGNKDTSLAHRIQEILELAKTAWLSYTMGNPEKKRNLLRIITSNREATKENLMLTMVSPFSAISNRHENSYGAPQRDIPRMWDVIIENLQTQLKKNSPDSLPDINMAKEETPGTAHLPRAA